MASNQMVDSSAFLGQSQASAQMGSWKLFQIYSREGFRLYVGPQLKWALEVVWMEWEEGRELSEP